MRRDALADRWVALLKPMFPRNAWLDREVSNKGIKIEIGWLLMNDPGRPDKPSRSIQIMVSEETIQNCRDVIFADRKIKEYVQQRLHYFNPEHNTPKGLDPPVELWIIDL